MTLKGYLEHFYSSCCSAAGIDLPTAQTRWNRSFVITLLNKGWEKAADEMGGLLYHGKHNLVSGQEDYTLPTNLCRLDKVEILKGGELYVTMTPEASWPLEFGDAVVDSGVPMRCAWKLQERDSSTATYELRLLPPANWSETGALWITGAVMPTAITADTDSPDCPDSLGMAGLWDACYKATRDRSFLVDYVDELRAFNRKGLVNLPVTRQPVWGGAGERTDFNSMSRGS